MTETQPTLMRNRKFGTCSVNTDPELGPSDIPEWRKTAEYKQDGVYFDANGIALGPPEAIAELGNVRAAFTKFEEAQQALKEAEDNALKAGVDAKMAEGIKVRRTGVKRAAEAPKDALDGFRTTDSEQQAQDVRERGPEAASTVVDSGDAGFDVNAFQSEMDAASSLMGVKEVASRYGFVVDGRVKDVVKAKENVMEQAKSKAGL